jgi:aminopeptidase N
VPPDFIATLRHVLQTQQDDAWLLSEMLMLPSEKYVAQLMTEIDVDAIHTARETMLIAIATQLRDDLLQVYQSNHVSAQSQTFSMKAAGQRYLKNRCLSYLMLLADASCIQLGVTQFESALSHNMSDTIGALYSLANTNSAERELTLAKFYQTWRHNQLVIDKWFTLQATSKLPDTLSNVKKLLQHEAFDIKNPNKVYALVGAFGQHNPVRFHAATGEGYAFLSDVVQRLDAMNPQVAARMITPLISWRRYDKNRQSLMREQLEVIIKKQGTSRDVYELTSKSLD